MTTTIDDEADDFVRTLSHELLRPEAGECLACFVDRMLVTFGCNGTLRFATWYRDTRAPRATALTRTLGRMGGYCDCEIFWNAYDPVARLWTEEREIEHEDGWIEVEEAEPPATMPSCEGVRAGSTRACPLWTRRRRGLGW